jgi:hypothetical protein
VSRRASGAGRSIWLRSFRTFKAKRWITGNEYLASVEFGSEIEVGGGKVVLLSFKVEVK